MIFPRTVPTRVYKNYHDYKPLLRRDFLNRCAYCLRHEFHFGGEANGQIDHFYPAAEFKRTGQPHLSYAYSNLFWSCGECNNIKRESWPDASEASLGFRFVDSTQEDTDEHWEVLPTGEIRALTPAGEYTIDIILLWRDDLVRWRRSIMESRQRIERLKEKMSNRLLTAEDRSEFHEQMRREILFVYPHPFDRPTLHPSQ
jgi:hypothetical protein